LFLDPKSKIRDPKCEDPKYGDPKFKFQIPKCEDPKSKF
jgi:hypothetical protein